MISSRLAKHSFFRQYPVGFGRRSLRPSTYPMGHDSAAAAAAVGQSASGPLIVQSQFSKLPAPGFQEPAVYCNRWEIMWSLGLQPGQRFDAGASSPAIVDLVTSGQLDVKGKRVLVPGCGRGYDVALFHRHGATQAVGLELAPTAVQAARQYLAAELAEAGGPGAGEAAAAGEAGAAGAGEGAEAVVLPPGVAMEEGNFFEWTSPQGDGSFDVGYDYTFGCAMDPPSRAQWAAHWSRHLAPGALLVTLVFPIMPDADPNVGPPFPISPQLYRELLEPHGFEAVYHRVVPHELSHGPRAGKEEMMIWRKK